MACAVWPVQLGLLYYTMGRGNFLGAAMNSPTRSTDSKGFKTDGFKKKMSEYNNAFRRHLLAILQRMACRAVAVPLLRPSAPHQ